MPLSGRDSQRLKVRLPEQQALPEITDLYQILGEAERMTGRLIELPWFLMDTFQSFALTVEFEAAQKTPAWSLYQRLDDTYRLIWTCRDTDVFLLHDILSMFMSQPQSKSSAPRDSVKRTHKEAMPEERPFLTEPEAAGDDSQTRVTMSEHLRRAGGGAQSMSHPGEWVDEDKAENRSPAREKAEVSEPPTAPRDASEEHSAPAEMSMAEESSVAVESSVAAEEPAAKGRAVAAEEARTTDESETTERSVEKEESTAYENVPAQEESTSHKVGYFDKISEEEFQELKERPNLLLGRLLVESGAIPDGLLDAALKLQEMVRTESLTPDQSIDAMRRAYHRTAAERKADTGDASDSSEGRLVSELLYEAGIINRDDIEAACRLKAQRGKELEILRSSGKIDKRLEEAAINCLRFMRKGLIRHEQAVIAINYSHRSRVPLNEAFVDLGWDYPY